MAPLPAIFSDLEGHFRCLKLCYLTYLGKYNSSKILLNLNNLRYLTTTLSGMINFVISELAFAAINLLPNLKSLTFAHYEDTKGDTKYRR